MNEKYASLRKICNDINIAEGKTTDEYLFTIDAVDLFFFKRNIGGMDIRNGFTDGANDGGIDFVYSDGETLHLIQGKSTSSLSVEDIKNVFHKMAETAANFEEKKYSQYSQALVSAYLNEYDNTNDDKNIQFVLFTNTILTEDMTRKLLQFMATEAMASYDFAVYDSLAIQEKEAMLFQNSDLIEEDTVEMYLDDRGGSNILYYGDTGIILNVKASEIKRLYNKYAKKGLFSYNLREHITQKSVDDGIDNTIKSEKDNFWFYNNGVTIGCEDFYKDGNRIKLYGFSIINGAQTTTKIGESKRINSQYDFAIVCKIVKAEKSVSQDSDFISKISEASNSQKPIKPRDLKSNAREQKILQSMCANNEKYTLSVEVKRGVRSPNYKKVEPWQRVTNEYIGQLIYACLLQHPGPARNSKNTMFSSAKVYQQLFQRKHDYDTLYDLVRLGNTYDEFGSRYARQMTDLDYIAVAKNGKLMVLAVTIYLVKKQRKIIRDCLDENLHKDNVTGLLVTDYPDDDLDNKLDGLFRFIIHRLKQIYESKKVDMKITSYSNFFKSDQVYEIVLRDFDSLDDYDTEKLESFMVVFSKKKSDY